MQIITPLNAREIYRTIERAARTCYKSEDKISEDSAPKLIRRLIKNGHEAAIEHYNLTVKFICDRGISHEIVRHRLASYCQVSTRYCNYSRDKFGNEISVIRPSEIKRRSREYDVWHEACSLAEDEYFKLLRLGAKPETARAVLPTCLATEIVMTANIREWRHFIKLRGSQAAHPDIRILARELYDLLVDVIPALFDDIKFDS